MSEFNGYGATPDDWAVLDIILGLTEDLLPVVSNPHALVAPNSKLKDTGKVPSVFNQQRQVVGLAKWTERRTTDLDIAKWQKEKDYGICVQTRRVRAIDVDVNDTQKAAAIVASIQSFLGIPLLIRSRSNSGKCLLLFTVEGEIPKSVVKVDGGIIERLGNGQQFVVSGTHPSGTRYELQWPTGARTIPTLSREEWDALWAMLVEKFGIEAAAEGALRRRGTTTTATNDYVATHLIETNATIGEGNDGGLYVECPWKSGHSCDSGETETAYYPAGTNGYEQGHFKCLHASCAHRTDDDFKNAFGCGIEADFDVLPDDDIQTPSGAKTVALPPLKRATKRGSDQATIMPTIGNLLVACRRSDICRWHIALDEYTDAIVYAPHGTDDWREFKDADYVALREWLEAGSAGFDPIGREMIRDVVLKVADENRIDTAQIWLSKRIWDGVPRVEMFLTKYMGVEDSPYARAVSRYIWSALAGRIMQPGVKADMVPIFIGAQGIMKSTAVAAMAPKSDWFTEVKLDDRDDNLSRQLRGKVVVELPELSGLHTRELEAIKAWITKTFEEWVPKYREFATKFWRRCLFIGTTNLLEFLADKTGNRRWLPAVCNAVDIAALKRDRDQLWAEGAEQFELMGVDWSVEKLSGEVHERHMMTDAWEDLIAPWLDKPDTNDIRDKDSEEGIRQYVQVPEILTQCLEMSKSQINKGHEMRVSAILRKLGWVRGRAFANGKQFKAWVRSGKYIAK